ncbi:unnamed protein product [Dicrocoelium dendriticum]|nr:unnamed protein product [Dicrocoelium dendriticum]
MVSRGARTNAIKRLHEWLSISKFLPIQRVDPACATSTHLQSCDPATCQPLVQFKETCNGDLDKIIEEASRAQKAWCMQPPLERAKILHKLAELIRSESEWLAELETLDTGKPLWESLNDINACADVVTMFAGFLPTLNGTHSPVPPNPASFYYTRREPFGVCAGIGAWNFPFQMAVWKSAPAVAAGNAFIFKPSPLTPLTAVRLTELYTKAGCPNCLFSVVLGGSNVGQALINNPNISKVSFTGSVVGGKSVLSSSAHRIVPATIELGGNSALIIMPDSDLDEAVKGALMANYFTQGQVCSNANRVFVHKSIAKAFQEKLIPAVRNIRVGDPFDPATSMGALISPEHTKKVQGYIHSAISEGGMVLIGGTQPTFPPDCELDPTNFLTPCVVANCHDDMLAVKEEIFGPVMTLLEFQDEEEVIQRANNSPFGLAGGVFTRDLRTAHRIAAELQCGTVYVNTYNAYPPGIPFGGYKQSGYGRENSLDTLLSYTQLKSIYVEGGSLPNPFPT